MLTLDTLLAVQVLIVVVGVGIIAALGVIANKLDALAIVAHRIYRELEWERANGH